jgi:hypothetical protein
MGLPTRAQSSPSCRRTTIANLSSGQRPRPTSGHPPRPPEAGCKLLRFHHPPRGEATGSQLGRLRRWNTTLRCLGDLAQCVVLVASRTVPGNRCHCGAGLSPRLMPMLPFSTRPGGFGTSPRTITQSSLQPPVLRCTHQERRPNHNRGLSGPKPANFTAVLLNSFTLLLLLYTFQLFFRTCY